MNIKESKKFVIDIGWVFLGNVSIIGVTLLQRLFIARFMGAEELGAFSLIMSIFAIGTALIAFGIPAALTKYISEIKNQYQKLKDLSSLGLIITGVFGILTSCFFLLISSRLSALLNISRFSHIVILLALIFPFSTLFYTSLAILNGKREMKSYFLFQTLQNLLYLLITIIFLLLGFGLKSILLALWLSVLITNIMLIFKKHLYIASINVVKLLNEAKQLIRFGTKVLLTDLVNQVNVYIDTLLLGFFHSPENVGYYAVALSILQLIWIIPGCIQKITYPTVSEYWARNDKLNLNRIINKTIHYSFLVAIILGVGISIFARGIITIIFGKGFEAAIIPIQILILGFVVNGTLTKSIGGTMAAINRPDLDLKIDTITVLMNILLNLYLIPQYGIIGAAIAKTMSLISHSVIYVYLCFSIAKLKIELKSILLIVAIAIPLILTKWMFNSSTFNFILFIAFSLIVIRHHFYGKELKFIKSLLN